VTGAGPDGDDPPVPAARDGLVRGAHWGLLAFFLGLGGYHLVTLAISALVAGSLDQFDPLELHNVGPLLLLAFLPNLLLGLGPAFGSRRWGNGLRRDFGLVPNWRDVKVGLACGGFALLAGYLLNLVLLAAYGTDRVPDSPLTELSDGLGDNTVWLALAAVVVVIGAPVTEELLVRGALWGSLEFYRVPRWAILVLTAIVFAHLHGEPTRTIALFGQGLAMGVARMVTGRVGAGIVAHAANNLPPALLLFAAS
jgi:membrane protease YdiL (CAAX protease family)